jgi:hypothetical protein
MNERPDLERLVSSWLHADASTAGADRVLAAALTRVSTDRLERPWPSVRAMDVSLYGKLAAAAAAGVIVAVVGMNLLQPSGGVGGSAPTATGSASSSPTARPSPPPLSSIFYPEGLSFAAPMLTWESHDFYLSKSTKGPQGAEAIIFWTSFPDGESPGQDPTGYERFLDVVGSAAEPSVSDLAAAVSSVAGTEVVTGPSDVTVGGHDGIYVELFVTYRILDNGAVCYPGLFYSWLEDDGGAFWGDLIPGDTIRVWMVDVDGTPVFIEAATHWNAGPAVADEIQQIIDSIQFE